MTLAEQARELIEWRENNKDDHWDIDIWANRVVSLLRLISTSEPELIRLESFASGTAEGMYPDV